MALLQTRTPYHPKELAAVAVAAEMPMLLERMAPEEEEAAGTAVPEEEEEEART